MKKIIFFQIFIGITITSVFSQVDLAAIESDVLIIEKIKNVNDADFSIHKLDEIPQLYLTIRFNWYSSEDDVIYVEEQAIALMSKYFDKNLIIIDSQREIYFIEYLVRVNIDRDGNYTSLYEDGNIIFVLISDELRKEIDDYSFKDITNCSVLTYDFLYDSSGNIMANIGMISFNAKDMSNENMKKIKNYISKEINIQWFDNKPIFYIRNNTYRIDI